MSITLDKGSLSRSLDRLRKKLEKDMLDSLISVMRTDLIPDISANLMRVFDAELVSKEPSYDPAVPSAARSAFKESIEGSLNSTLLRKGNTISLATGDIKELNLDNLNLSSLSSVGRGPKPLDWLVFYLEGFIGDFAFITEETFKKFVDAGLTPKKSFDKFSSWGWYGKGFMIPQKAYFARKFNDVVPYPSVRHPFSGVHPTLLFERAMEGIDFSKIVEKALKRATGR